MIKQNANWTHEKLDQFSNLNIGSVSALILSIGNYSSSLCIWILISIDVLDLYYLVLIKLLVEQKYSIGYCRSCYPIPFGNDTVWLPS